MLKIRQVIFGSILRRSTSDVIPKIDFSPIGTNGLKYTSTECARILDTINNKSFIELQNYDISKTRANKLTAFKKSNGPFTDVRDILLVEGFSLKSIAKFYRSLLQTQNTTMSTTKKSTSRPATYITPSMDEEIRSAITSSVSINVGVSSVTWSRLLSPHHDSEEHCLLTHWHHHNITEKKLSLGDLVHRSLYIQHLIPAADCYLFEDPLRAQSSMNPANTDQQSINMQRAQLTAILAYALAMRGWKPSLLNEQHMQGSPKSVVGPTVFYLRRFLAARLFNNVVGTERVSSEANILTMMRIYDISHLKDHGWDSALGEAAGQTVSRQSSSRGNIQFSVEFRNMFSRADRFERELLGQTLLQNLAFVRLVLLQDSDSISKVRGGLRTSTS